MAFSFKEAEIKGVWEIIPHMYPDDRGLYKKNFEKEIFAEKGIDANFTEASDLYTEKGALRGLHYQTEQSQAKLVRVITGKVFDVAIDLRKNSETFGKPYTKLLDAEENVSVYIPAGFAHGFIALEKNTIFSYFCTGQYIPEACGGILWNSPELELLWPLKEYGIEEVIMTEKDRSWPTLEEYLKGVRK